MLESETRTKEVEGKMRRFVVLEVRPLVGGNPDWWYPVDKRPGFEALFLHPSRVIECADGGPLYTDMIMKGEMFINSRGDLRRADCDGERFMRLLCFPAPEREEVKGRKPLDKCNNRKCRYNSADMSCNCDYLTKSSQGLSTTVCIHFKPEQEKIGKPISRSEAIRTADAIREQAEAGREKEKCATCKHEDALWCIEPCCNCGNHTKWEQKEGKPQKRRGVKTPDGNVWECRDCPEVNWDKAFGYYWCGAESNQVACPRGGISKLCPLAEMLDDEPDPAEWCGGALGGAL